MKKNNNQLIISIALILSSTFANADYVIKTAWGVEFRNLSNAPSDQVATPKPIV